jgi:glycosyltransferase involved in cell wall biosynthesis
MKTIGLDGSRAFLRYRTGIEEYSYQVIKHLRSEIAEDTEVRLYVRKKLVIKNGRCVFEYPKIDFSLPPHWKCVGIWAPRFWTQIGLSLEMLFHPVERLFVPAHTLPLIGGKCNVVTVHGLEYEMSPESYSFWERLYMRYSIRYSCYKADTVIAVSENTKHDIVNLYGIAHEKIRVVGEGFMSNSLPIASNTQLVPYLLFIGRIEERKNIIRIVAAFEWLKEKYQIKENLVLVGKPGHGYEKIEERIQSSKWSREINQKGYVSENEKQELLRGASLFIFPSLYEGFGLPILEAQAASVPVVTSNTSSLPEVGGESAVYVDPVSVEDIAQGMYKVLTLSSEERSLLQIKMEQNLQRFSWRRCAQEIAQYLA